MNNTIKTIVMFGAGAVTGFVTSKVINKIVKTHKDKKESK
jgi:uncharacterized membrane protein